MNMLCRPRQLLSKVLLVVAAASLVPAAAGAAATKFKQIAVIDGGPAPLVPTARTADGTLHLVYRTKAATGGVDGLAARSISPAGTVGPQVQALSGWQPGQPGLVVLPNGTLEAVFGAIAPSPPNQSTIWGVSSSNGGSTWSAPVDVRSGPNEPFGYASDITARMSGATPILTVPQAGNLVIQVGLGPGAPTYQLNNNSDGSTVGVDSAVDSATGEVVASWSSLANPPTGGLYVQGAATTIGMPQLTPDNTRATHSTLIIAGRDSGPGVFGAYTTDGTHVRLLRYGGGSVAVGSLKGVTAGVLGVATGLGGRIWVMWGYSNGGIAITRSNKAVTRFEPIQHLNPSAFSLYRLSGDGRLGPLDLFVDMIQSKKNSLTLPSAFYARVLPELSAAISVHPVKNKAGKVIAFSLGAKVTDAGDAVAGATASAKGHHKKTNTLGVAKLQVTGTSGSHVTVTITHPGYKVLQKRITL
jgi:hypothetical protein